MIRWLEHPEYVRFLMKYIPGHTEDEIRKAFKGKYGHTLTEGQIGNFKNTYGVKSGTHGGQFIKGQSPPNKGMKMSKETYEKLKHTFFPKGHMPKNHRSVGSERINIDGYTEIKVKEPNRWKLKQRVIYEELHGVKLKKNEVVIFLDGDRQNFNGDNLHKMSRAALVRYNQDHLYTNNREISQAAAYIAEIKENIGRNEKSAGNRVNERPCAVPQRDPF